MKENIAMKLFFSLLVFTISHLTTTQMNSQTPSLIFNIRPLDQQFLRYFLVHNTFDSAIVGYEFGEISVGSGTSWSRVYLELSRDEVKVAGSNPTGPDQTLSSFLVSKTFTFTNQDSIRFFRLAYISGLRSCDPSYGPSQGGGGPGSGSNGKWTSNDWWSTITGAIKDNQSFVLELVDSANGTVAAVLDSVFVGSNPTTSSVPHYGVNLDKIFVQRDLVGLGINTKYFVRLTPHRNGPTPFGMVANQHGCSMAQSYMFAITDSSMHRFDSTQRVSFYNDYQDSALSYIEEYVDTAGYAPGIFDLTLSPETYDTVVNRYFDSVQVNGVWLLRPKNPPMWKESRSNVAPSIVKSNGDQPEPEYRSWFIRPSPNPRITDELIVTIDNVKTVRRVEMILFNNIGEKIATRGTHVVPGSNSIVMKQGALANEVAFLTIFDSHGNVIKTLKVIKQ